MQANHFDFAAQIIGQSYADQAAQARTSRAKKVTCLLTQRRIPEEPWTEAEVETFLHELAAMDSNNFGDTVGVGEREGRISASLVRRRHFGFAHGMGRSGDLRELQPKAAGSSLVARLAEFLSLDAVRRVCGVRNAEGCCVLPVATGMALAFCLLFLKRQKRKQMETESKERKEKEREKHDPLLNGNGNPHPQTEDEEEEDEDEDVEVPRRVLWSRIDQKSCVKAVGFADCRLEVIELEMVEEEEEEEQKEAAETDASTLSPQTKRRRRYLRTDVDALRRRLEKERQREKDGETNKGCMLNGDTESNKERPSITAQRKGRSCKRGRGGGILAVVTTTSCFAPREPDDIVAVAALCKEFGVPHVVNNAYGLQCGAICHALNEACRSGRVDFFVQSGDKNFQIPVGGSLVCSPQKGLVEAFAKTYAGRANSATSLDLLITFLQTGVSGLTSWRRERKELNVFFRQLMKKTAGELGLRTVEPPRNKISFIIDLLPLCLDTQRGGQGQARNSGRQTEGGGETKGKGKDAGMISALGSLLFRMRCTGHRVCVPKKANEGSGASGEKKKAASRDSEKEMGEGEGDSLVCPVSQPGCDPGGRSSSFSSPAVAVGAADVKIIDGVPFENFGCHSDEWRFPYMTVACAIGASKESLEIFAERFAEAVRRLTEKKNKK
uniref:O-phosphoseryl-tRNA(Sec) selenium transferase n=1 Tax=Chromera velia CCMP2878 TaxID=1169474 RepID=A0A0G4HB06_9ALVE|eukprot:Cvel_6144.t1-p1 / transcript=Cvel_6144.t1 / gene=Cvel_6144 / organism=Chromera_velia_CCMP2878 / gene_product=O-phosphoseryl-tRNA(Sec) selenium transferase, putative / transcript_product=O-phosphoseryl-tRNA(Sec) selenium transferase, putative / location=Cvel_scaffold297:46277-54782(+) / protein_length=667 / sequence_SO=supercontig / SO=protein_coding / is_pseudo=false